MVRLDLQEWPTVIYRIHARNIVCSQIAQFAMLLSAPLHKESPGYRFLQQSSPGFGNGFKTTHTIEIDQVMVHF